MGIRFFNNLNHEESIDFTDIVSNECRLSKFVLPKFSRSRKYSGVNNTKDLRYRGKSEKPHRENCETIDFL